MRATLRGLSSCWKYGDVLEFDPPDKHKHANAVVMFVGWVGLPFGGLSRRRALLTILHDEQPVDGLQSGVTGTATLMLDHWTMVYDDES